MAEHPPPLLGNYSTSNGTSFRLSYLFLIEIVNFTDVLKWNNPLYIDYPGSTLRYFLNFVSSCAGVPGPVLGCLSLYPTINNFARRLGKAVQV
jgi:hypothetical protein